MLVLNTISEVHDGLGLEKPTHPLISISKQNELDFSAFTEGTKVRTEVYQIWLKDGGACRLGYGRNTYDFQEGTLGFSKPGQVLTSYSTANHNEVDGFLVLFHPDLIRGSHLAETIESYSFFNYEVSEALHVSDQERATLEEIILIMCNEIKNSIDKHSQHIIVSNLELLLGYCHRYYDRQFIVRSNINKDLISSFERVLLNYYNEGKQLDKGVPSVSYCASQLNLSPNYLSDLLKKETGLPGQSHIQEFIINKAKNKLLATNDPLKSIAYELGFDYSQHFSNMFRKKTGMTPSEFRTIHVSN